MRNSDTTAILGHLQAALESEVGVSLEFISPDDAKEYRQKVLMVRREHTRFRVIATKIQENELWLLNQGETPISAEETVDADSE